MAQQLLTNFTPPGSTSSYKFRAGGLFYGTASGSASAMTVTIPGVGEYYTGLTIILSIATTIQPASGCTLNINSLGPKSIIYGYNEDATHFVSGATYLFVYDGTQFKGIHSYDRDTTYTTLGLDEGKTGTAQTGHLISAERLKTLINYFAPTKTGVGASGDWNINSATTDAFNGKTNVSLTGDVTGTYYSACGWTVPTTITDGVVTNIKLAGGITNDKLASPSFTIVHGNQGNTISLGDTVASSDLSAWLGLTNYSAGTGLSLSGTTFNHSNSITAKTAYTQNTTSAPGYGGTFKVFEPLYDAQGHITGVRSTTVTMPGAQNLPTTFTITANGSGDGIVTLNKANGSNAVTYNVAHEKMFGKTTTTNTYTSGNTTISIAGSAGTGKIKIPQISIDEYGHVTAASDEEVTITMPTIPTALKNPNKLTVGSKTYDGSSAVTITASDLGLANALHFIGSLTALPSTTTGYVNGDVVLVGDFEYVCCDGAWNKLGDDTSFAYKTIKINAGDGLTGGGDLGADRTLSLATIGTAGTYGPTANVSGSNNATIKVPQITVDAYGRVTSITERTYTSKNSNTTYDLAASTSSTNGNVKINLTAGGSGSGTDSVTIKGSGATSVTTDENGIVIVNSNNTTYSAGTGISFSGTTINNSGVRSVASGTTNGTISVNTNGTSTDVAVQGLGSAAYTESSAYAEAGHTHNYAGSSSAGGAANSVQKSIIIKLNGGTTEGTDSFTFNGSTAKTINITPSAIGASLSTHTHTVAHTPAGSVSQPTFTGTKATISTTYTPAGSVSQPTFTGNAVASGAPSATTTVQSITSVGTTPTLTMSVTNKCLSIVFSAGSTPTREAVTVPTSTHTHTTTATGTVSKPTFTGTQATISTNYTPAGTVSKPTFTGTAATLTSSAPQ